MARELAVLILLAACKREEAAPVARERGAKPPLASKAFYRLDAGACSASACELVLTALGDYHINEQYPTKFVADDGAVTASRFAVTNAKTGTMTLQLRAGTRRITGTFKLGVCTDDNCEIETPHIALDVTAG